MSVTTTANPITLSLQQTLGEYEVHITGDGSEQDIKPPNPRGSETVANPPNWPRNYHRVPPRRPARNLVGPERPLGAILPEQVFLHVMFTGVSLNAGVAQLWGATGGKYFTKIFKYAIGGEW
ncbi:hypothetical protein VTL71DRAFT_7826 [Oculimacula yallundae]|uniref:Uncharacterized protein n=1 Tax=Oculimacula yallundae TaxID=86028 RepID=A0ABR4CXF2_9HELO